MSIKYFFEIYFLNKNFKVIYAQLYDNTFTKIYTKNNRTEIDVISPSEYTAAMVYNNIAKMKDIKII
jgi:hypothetical protein